MNVPTPRFSIGDVVYGAHVVETAVDDPCPDCLDERKWLAVLPSGERFPIECPTCTSSYVSFRPYRRRVAVAQFFSYTVGSIHIDTNREPGKRVSYMCCETGVGSGSVYYECNLSASRAEAEEAVVARVEERQKEMDERWLRELKDRRARAASEEGRLRAEIRECRMKIRRCEERLRR